MTFVVDKSESSGSVVFPVLAQGTRAVDCQGAVRHCGETVQECKWPYAVVDGRWKHEDTRAEPLAPQWGMSIKGAFIFMTITGSHPNKKNLV